MLLRRIAHINTVKATHHRHVTAHNSPITTDCFPGMGHKGDNMQIETLVFNGALVAWVATGLTR